MGLPLSMIDRLRSYGVPDEDIEFLNDGWSKPVESVTKRHSDSVGAARTRRWRERHKASQVTSQSVTMGETIEGELISLEKKKKEKENAELRDVTELFDAYNVCAAELGWARAEKLTKPRRAAIRRCIADSGGLEKAFAHLNDFANSDHGRKWCAGDNPSGWKADIDYVTRASKWVHIIEGKFNGVQTHSQGTNGRGSATSGGHV